MQGDAMKCCIHYFLYNDEKLFPLREDHHERLVEAKKARLKLGGDNVHPDQGAGIPPTFTADPVFAFHQNCYKK